MIIGNGLIANAFRNSDREDVIYFASGVSNSLETSTVEFRREEDLLREIIAINQGKILVYFSTCSIYDSSKNDSLYVNHKLNMEHIVANSCDKFLILRVSNAVGKGGNRHTLINHLCQSIQNHEEINVHINATRNLIDVEDVVRITSDLIQNHEFNQILNIAYPENYNILEIIQMIEEFLGLKAKLNLEKRGMGYAIDIREIRNYFTKNKEEYMRNLLEKHYTSS